MIGERLATALAAFHSGLAHTGAVRVASSGPPGQRPWLRVLAAAGLGGLVLFGSAMPSGASELRAASPPVAGANTVLVRGFLPGEGGTPFMARLTMCVQAQASGTAIQGPIALREARIAGFATSGGWDGERVTPHMTEDDFARFIGNHEDGHCADEVITLPSEAAKLSPVELDWRGYRQESFADAYAALQELRAGHGTATAVEFGDLRVIGLLENAVRRGAGDDERWARYYTTPAIDAVLAAARQLGFDAITSMTDAQVAALTTQAVATTSLSRPDWEAMRTALVHTELNGSHPTFAVGVPPGFAERLDAALTRTGVELRPVDCAASIGAVPN